MFDCYVSLPQCNVCLNHIRLHHIIHIPSSKLSLVHLSDRPFTSDAHLEVQGFPMVGPLRVRLRVQNRVSANFELEGWHFIGTVSGWESSYKLESSICSWADIERICLITSASRAGVVETINIKKTKETPNNWEHDDGTPTSPLYHPQASWERDSKLKARVDLDTARWHMAASDWRVDSMMLTSKRDANEWINLRSLLRSGVTNYSMETTTGTKAPWKKKNKQPCDFLDSNSLYLTTFFEQISVTWVDPWHFWHWRVNIAPIPSCTSKLRPKLWSLRWIVGSLTFQFGHLRILHFKRNFVTCNGRPSNFLTHMKWHLLLSYEQNWPNPKKQLLETAAPFLSLRPLRSFCSVFSVSGLMVDKHTKDSVGLLHSLWQKWRLPRVLFVGFLHLVLHDRNSAVFYHDRFNHSLGFIEVHWLSRDSYSWVQTRPFIKKREQQIMREQGFKPFIPNNVFQVDTAKSSGTTRQNCFFTAHEVEEGATWVSHHGVANQHGFSFFKRTSSSISACRVWSRATYVFNMFNRSCQTIQIIDMLHAECFVVAGHEWMNRFYITKPH